MLRAVVGLDTNAAALVLGKRAGAVRIAAHRGLKTLARRLEQSRSSGSDDLPFGIDRGIDV
jgi:RNA polymerase sigma-70 factor (ECF subfamily)